MHFLGATKHLYNWLCRRNRLHRRHTDKWKTNLSLLYGSQSMPIVSKCYKVGDERANGGVRFMDEVSDGVGS